ncbi:hypothetical protein A1OE_150 [Candidatus Endolissoclinum faulkneri L2]|uniref:Uncharacterized protein n=1 Tax=Candidatus Endolissoclinum faulkneri L2 TaxID=1193729 RepID=K7YP34_9PROT|nr:hypothetical protein A1OE_150 [Candidatus Endolissoclinum faulkneri L2]
MFLRVFCSWYMCNQSDKFRVFIQYLLFYIYQTIDNKLSLWKSRVPINTNRHFTKFCVCDC